MDFREMRARFDALWERHASGGINDQDYLAEVQKLTLRDDQGRWWTLGARTGKWYVSSGGGWVEASPPVVEAPTPPPPPPPPPPPAHPRPPAPLQPATMPCPQCGVPLKPGTSFCGSCGARLGVTSTAPSGPTPFPPPPTPARPPAPQPPPPDATVVARPPTPPPPPASGLQPARISGLGAEEDEPPGQRPGAPQAAPRAEQPLSVTPPPPAPPAPARRPTPDVAEMTCPHCGSSVQPGRRFCGTCGGRVEAGAAADQPALVLAPEPILASAVLSAEPEPEPAPAVEPGAEAEPELAPEHEPELEKEREPESELEPEVELVQEQEPEPELEREPEAEPEAESAPTLTAQTTACSQCGQPLKPGTRFCGNCGARFASAAVTPPAPSMAVHATVVPRPPAPLRPPPARPPAAGAQRVPPPPPLAFAPPPQTAPLQAPKARRRRGPLITVLALLGLLLVMAGGALAFSALMPDAPLSARLARLIARGIEPTVTTVPTAPLAATQPIAAPGVPTATDTVAPTAKLTPSETSAATHTPTAVTATATHTASATPTHTESPTPTETPSPTVTTAPPTVAATVAPPTAAPPTVPPPTAAPPTVAPPTVAPVQVLSSIPVSNGAAGQGVIWIEHLASIFINGADGHRYRAELGFLSSPESLAEVQRLWTAAGRGGANWRMRIQVQERVSWVACAPEASVCYDNVTTDGAQAVFSIQVHLKDHVWRSLLNDHLQRGWRATTQNQYYSAVQEAIFKPMASQKANVPCIGFTFTRAD